MTRFARKLRSEQTDAEQRIWSALRGRRFVGVKFRRQVPIGPYIVDFLCVRKKLVIELDGGQHFEPEGLRRDKVRDAFLASQGLRVLRFSDYEVLKDTETVLQAILAAFAGPHP